MSLRVLYGDDYQIVQSAILRHIYYQPPPGDWRYTVSVRDNFLTWLSGAYWYVPNGQQDISALFGFSPRGAVTTLTASLPPVSSRERDSLYDRTVYGNQFHSIVQFISTISAGAALATPSYARETATRHATFSGELAVGQTGIAATEETVSWGLNSYVGHTYGTSVVAYTDITSVNPTIAVPYSVPVLCPVRDLRDLAKFLKEHGTVVAAGGGYIQSLSNFDYEVTKTGFSCEYHSDLTGIPAWDHYHWDGYLDLSVQDNEVIVIPEVGHSYHTSYVGSWTFGFKNFTSGYAPWSGPFSDEVTVTANEDGGYPILLSLPSDTVSVVKELTKDVFSTFLKTDYLKNFRAAVDVSWRDIIPSSLFSTVDAFKEAEESIDNDVLQTLVKIPGIVEALPKVREAIDVISDLAHRKIDLLTIKEILDLLTSTNLQANFQWRPYKDIITKYIPQIVSTMGSLGDIRKNSIGYGSFRFKLTNELGRKEVTLLTRTKIVMDASPSGLLSAVLGLDSLGVLPKPSYLWDLVPFSFMVNWFTGVGKAIERAEYSLLLCTIPAYFVHTYLLTSPLTVVELDTLDVSSPEQDPAMLRTYYRDISVYSPFPHDSRFGFGIPHGLPPLGSLGSLLYQWIFH